MVADWRNPSDSLDVNGDGYVVPLDALVVINYLNSTRPKALPSTRAESAVYFDVSGDQFVTAIDALFVINHLNSGQSGQRKLVETSNLASEASVVVTLGQADGTRTYQVQLDTLFDYSDQSTAIEDVLAVYLVDPQTSTTILDRGLRGTPLFTLAGQKANPIPGRTSWDGSILTIDMSDLKDRETGLLKFQLLRSDSDNGTQVVIKPISNVVDPEAFSYSRPSSTFTAHSVGPTQDLTSLTFAPSVSVSVDNVRYDSAGSRYQAELKLHNSGQSLGSNAVVVFPGLPAGVTLVNASGTTASGDPYINASPSIAAGGLQTDGWSLPLALDFIAPKNRPFQLKPQVLADLNEPPILQPLASRSMLAGEVLRIPLIGSDPNGNSISYVLQSSATGGVTGQVEANGSLVFRPAPDELGMYQFNVLVSDGALTVSQPFTLDVVADPLTTTRVSGQILGVDLLPIANMPMEIGNVRGFTLSDGTFTLDLGRGVVTSTTLKIRGDLYSSNSGVYPFIAEKLPLLLEHPLFAGVNNVIDRPVYLPQLDVASGTMVQPTQVTTVTSASIPGATVVVAPGTLMDQQGTPFNGVLSMTEVPVTVTPAALPEGLLPGLVVTIQPGEMVFTRPTPLALPNTGRYAPGTMQDLWSIDPVSGEFQIVGVGQVSSNGAIIETVTGGIRNSSWHFYSPPAPTGPKVKDDPRNKKPGGCGDAHAATSSCETHTGALTETHALVSYQSQGQTRGISLTYDSLRANPRPIVHFTFDDLDPALYSVPSAVRLVAKLAVDIDGISQPVPGFAGNAYGLSGGEHFWRLPVGSGTVDAALQVDMTTHPSGIYDYSLRSGMLGYAGSRGFLGTLEQTSGQVVSINTIKSPFGAGWGISGLLELVESPDGSILIINGDGSEEVYQPETGGGYAHPAGLFSTLSKQPDGTFRRTWPDQTVERFNSRNQLQTVTDRSGNVTAYQYDINHRLIGITDAVGLRTTISYQAGQVEIRDPGGRATRLELDAFGNLVRVVDPDGSARRWNYDAQHRLTGETDQLGNSERSNYGPYGRITDVVRKDGSVRRFQPLDLQGLYPVEQTTADPVSGDNPTVGRVQRPEALFLDANGNSIIDTLDSQGQVVSSRDNVGQLNTVQRNGDNLPVQIVDGQGIPTWFTYDANGNVVTQSRELNTGLARPGNSLYMDGLNDSVDIPDSPSLRPTSLTLEGWVKLNTTSDIVALFSKPVGNGTFNSYQLYYSQGKLFGMVSDAVNYYLVAALWQPIDGTWAHVAMTFDDAADTFALYIDGAQVAERLVMASIAYDSQPLTIGADYDFGTRQFLLDGAVDDVRVWSVARTKQQIRSGMFELLGGGEPDLAAYYAFDASASDGSVLDSGIHHNNGTLLGAPAYASSGVTVRRPIQPPAGLVSWWTADGYANDVVVGNNGSARHGAAFAPGMVDLAFQFDGQDDHIRIEDAGDGSLDLVGDLTIGAWINPSSTAGDQRTIVGKRPSSGNNDVTYGLYLEADGRLAFTSRLRGGEFRTATTATTIPLNAWTHVAVSISNSTLQLYINGVSVTRNTYPFARPSTNGPVSIGSTIVNAATQHSFHGKLDEVQLFNRALSSDDLRSITRSGRAGQSKPHVFDATSDFSLTSNPNGPWQYGFSTTQDSTFTRTTSTVDTIGLILWGGAANGPFVIRPQTRTPAAYGSIQQSSDVLNLDPSLNGRNSVLQWTAPTAGTYRIAGRFEGDDSTTTDVTVRINDDAVTPLLSGSINGFGSQIPFNITKTLLAGDRIQFTVNPRGNSSYDSTGLSATVIAVDMPSGPTAASEDMATTSFTYDPTYNQLTSITDPLGRQTLFTVDPVNGNTSTVVDVVGAVGGADDRVTRLTYTSAGQVESVTNAIGIVTRYTYDLSGRLITVRNAFGTSVETIRQLQYDLIGRVTGSIDEAGRRTDFSYDVMNRLTRVTAPDGTTTSYTYDQRGNQRSQTDALGNTERWTYDALDNLKTATDVAANVTRYSYGLTDNLQSVTDPLGRTERYRYDVRGRVVAAIDSAGLETRYQYDALDQVTGLRDAAGNQTTWIYDGNGRVVRRTDTFGASAHFSYDAAGYLIQSQDRTGRITKFAYDDLGQLVSEDWLSDNLDLANSVQYNYDAAGRLTRAADLSSSLTYAYDVLNRVVSEAVAGGGDLPNALLQITYDAVGNVTSRRETINGVVGATNVLTYDTLNRLTKVIQTGSGVTSKRVDFSYDVRGQFKTLSRYADVAGQNVVATTSFAQDAQGRLTQLTHKNASSAVLNSITYQYDTADRITRIADIDGAHDYTYDLRSQLTSASHADPLVADETYRYDAVGNRVSSHLHGSGYRVSEGGAGTGNGNRLSTDGRYTYHYDADGQLVERVEIHTGESREFVYDHRSRLVQVTDRTGAAGPTTQVVNYIYDAVDRRIAMMVDRTPSDGQDGAVTYFVYSGQDVVADVVDSDGTGPAAVVVSKRYLHGPAVDQVLAQDDGTTVEWLLSDHLNTITDMVTSQGTVVNHLQYDSYGNLIAQTNPAIQSRYGYTGREFDSSTNLQYNRARYYDAAIGRFISEDPAGFAGGSVNLFAYVGNRPTQFVDPSGHVAVGVATAATGYVGGYYGSLAAQAFGPGGGGLNDVYYGNFNFDAAFVSGAFGAASGAALAIPGVGIAGATAIGAGSNLAQYGYTTPKEDWNAGDAAWNFGTGGLAGLGGGVAGKAIQKFGPVKAGGNFGPTLYGGKAVTAADHVKANIGPKSAASAVAGGFGSNLPNLGAALGKKPDKCELKR